MISAGACNWDKGRVRDGTINGRTNSTYTC